MPGELTATCFCGSVRISCGKPVGARGVLLLRRLPKNHWSAFSVNVPFETGEFQVVAGESSSFTKTADSDNKLMRYFCWVIAHLGVASRGDPSEVRRASKVAWPASFAVLTTDRKAA